MAMMIVFYHKQNPTVGRCDTVSGTQTTVVQRVSDRSRSQSQGLYITSSDTALNKTFMEVDGIGQLGRFHCIINYGTQIVSWKKSQSAVNIWNFP